MRTTSPLFSLLLGLALGPAAFAPGASANCYCSGANMDGEVPLEGLLVLPNDSCSSESRSMWMTDEDGLGVSGRVDLEIASFQATSNIYWRPDAPLSPGASYTYYHVVKDGSRDFNSYGCEVTASVTASEVPFPEMVQPLAEMTELIGNWVPQFACYAPRYWLDVTKSSDPALAPYYRYTISVVRGEQVNPVKWQLGGPPETFDHYADWAVNWRGGAPFQDEYCLRVDAWEIVNGTATTEDFCVTNDDLVGAPTTDGAPDEAVPAGAICDPSIDVTNPITNTPPTNDPPHSDDPPPSDAPQTAQDSGCNQGEPAHHLPALLLSLLLLSSARRRRAL